MGVCASNEADAYESQPDQRKKSGGLEFKDPSKYYKTLKVLGVGASCEVVSASNLHTKELVAMKKITKPDGQNQDLDDNAYLFKNEVKILSELKHPNILEFIECFEDRKRFYLVTKMCHGGELFDRVTSHSKGFSEAQASKLAYQMIVALQHCHSLGIMHRDLKPENFVFDTEDEDSNMKLIDFGCAVKAADDEIIADVAGSPYYVAPEVLSSKFRRTGSTWKASDMWSIGVIIFLLVHGYPPYNGESQEQIFRRIKRGQYRINSRLQLSKYCKDLISKLLVTDCKRRITADQALQHPWIAQKGAAPSTPLPAEVTKGLKTFGESNKLKKAVGHMLAGAMSAADENILRENFDRFDKDGNGQLDASEIRDMLDYIGGHAMSVQHMLDNYDDDGNGALEFDEFKAAYGQGALEDEKVTLEMFKKADKDGNGAVDAKELAEMLNIKKKDAEAIIADVDDDKNGTIDFNEWQKAMRNQAQKKTAKKKRRKKRK